MPVELKQKNGAPWWIELLRREGVLTLIIVGYGYCVMVPEMRIRNEAIAAQTQLVAQLAESDKNFAKVLTDMKGLLERAEGDHHRIAKKLGCE